MNDIPMLHDLANFKSTELTVVEKGYPVDSLSVLPEDYIVTSHSIDGTFESCPRRFEFLHVWMKAPDRERDSFAADVGTALHEASQEYIRRLFFGDDHDTADFKAICTLLQWWPWDTELARLDDKRTLGGRTLGNALLMLEKIQESMVWKDWELVTIEGYGPAIEVPYRIIHRSLGGVPTPRGTIAYFATQGKMDFILRHRATGKYRVWDLKTTEKDIPAHNASFRFSGQGSHYGLVLNHALGVDWQRDGLDVTYLVAHFGAYDLTVYPLHYSYDAEEIQDMIDGKLQRLARMKEFAIQGHWPRTQHGCSYYNTACAFLDVCHRRDPALLSRWFEFEEASGRFREYTRIYTPVWEIEA